MTVITKKQEEVILDTWGYRMALIGTGQMIDKEEECPSCRMFNTGNGFFHEEDCLFRVPRYGRKLYKLWRIPEELKWQLVFRVPTGTSFFYFDTLREARSKRAKLTEFYKGLMWGNVIQERGNFVPQYVQVSS